MEYIGGKENNDPNSVGAPQPVSRENIATLLETANSIRNRHLREESKLFIHILDAAGKGDVAAITRIATLRLKQTMACGTHGIPMEKWESVPEYLALLGCTTKEYEKVGQHSRLSSEERPLKRRRGELEWEAQPSFRHNSKPFVRESAPRTAVRIKPTICYACRQPGHRAAECPNKGPEKANT